jgi:hypothetical protein
MRDDLADRVEVVMAEAAAALRRLDRPRDWLDQLGESGFRLVGQSTIWTPNLISSMRHNP